MGETDYILGIGETELERLGVQHRVWRDRTLALWERAGLASGMTVVDFGCGPGHATLDLARIVGPAGRVIAIDRAPDFLATLRQTVRDEGLAQIEVVDADLATDRLPAYGADFLWSRWVLSFTIDRPAAVANLAATLRPGGTVAIHELIEYGTQRMSPPVPAFDTYVSQLIAGWRASGGEPNLMADLPRLLDDAGIDTLSIEPMMRIARPHDAEWQWLAGVIASTSARFTELGAIDAARAEDVRAAFAAAEADPLTRLIPPLVGHLIGRKRD
jgi:ubiquinone/menaquinone biosynthesis C-methylase UbiE